MVPLTSLIIAALVSDTMGQAAGCFGLSRSRERPHLGSVTTGIIIHRFIEKCRKFFAARRVFPLLPMQAVTAPLGRGLVDRGCRPAAVVLTAHNCLTLFRLRL